MKSVVVILAASLCCAALAHSGVLGDKIELGLSARGKFMTGYTKYTIDFSEMHLFQGSNVVVNYASELEFPLDVFVTEYTLTVGGKMIKNLPWTLNASYATNVDDPGNSMKDSDWLRVPAANFDEKISYTESDAALTADIFNIYWKAAVWSGNGIRFDAFLGYEYQKFSFDLTGVAGWQLDTALNPISFDEYAGETVLTYEVKYHIPYAGVAAAVDIIHDLDIDATVKASPLVSAKDRDDHVLRDKIAAGDVTGGMVSIGGGVSYTLSAPKPNLMWIFSLGYEYTHISATGTQTQTWYGDDPATVADDTGTQITGIADKLKSEQQGLTLTIALRF